MTRTHPNDHATAVERARAWLAYYDALAAHLGCPTIYIEGLARDDLREILRRLSKLEADKLHARIAAKLEEQLFRPARSEQRWNDTINEIAGMVRDDGVADG